MPPTIYMNSECDDRKSGENLKELNWSVKRKIATGEKNVKKFTLLWVF